MKKEQREYVLNIRKTKKCPWHSLPHTDGGRVRFHIVAACYEHHHYIGQNIERIAEFERDILNALTGASKEIYAYAILPNRIFVALCSKLIAL